MVITTFFPLTLGLCISGQTMINISAISLLWTIKI